MKPRHQISRAAIELIKRFEGYRSKAAKLADGRWTIGYGHTLTAREGAEVSEKDAEALLLYDLIAVAHAVNESVYTPLNQNQFDALCCFAFNIGLENFRKSSVLRRINEGQMLQAACGMELWRKADFEGERIIIDALVRRRAAEKTLFLTPLEGWVPAPSPILRPNIDADIAGVVPRQTPVAVRAALDGEQAVAVRDAPAGITPTPPEEEDEPSPAQAAAAAVSHRLQAIFREPEASDVSQPQAAADAPDVPVTTTAATELAALPAPPATSEPTPEARPAASPEPSLVARAAGERTFVLTQPEEEAAPEAWPEPAPAQRKHEEPSEDSRGLFDRHLEAANDPLEAPAAPLDDAQPEPPKEQAAPRLVIDDTETEPQIMTFQSLPATSSRGDLGALLTLAAAGLALFAGGLFWAFNARVTEGGLISPLTIGWVAGILGVAFFGVAAYLVLQRLGQDDTEEDDLSL